MKKKISIVFLLCFVITNFYAQTYIQNVTVVDVINQKLIPNQTVSGLRATESSRSPAFWAERERFYEGLSKAGLAP